MGKPPPDTLPLQKKYLFPTSFGKSSECTGSTLYRAASSAVNTPAMSFNKFLKKRAYMQLFLSSRKSGLPRWVLLRKWLAGVQLLRSLTDVHPSIGVLRWWGGGGEVSTSASESESDSVSESEHPPYIGLSVDFTIEEITPVSWGGGGGGGGRPT